MTDLGIIPAEHPERRWRPEHSSTDTFARFREAWPDFCNHGGKALTALLRIVLLIPASIFVIFAGAAVWLDQWLLIAVEPQEKDVTVWSVSKDVERIERWLGGAQ